MDNVKPPLRHVVKAWKRMPMKNDGNKEPKFFIEIENGEDVKGKAPIVKFTVQSDPIGEVGINGCKAVDMLEYVKYLFESLNDVFPCQENEATIENLKGALYWQNERTKNRISRQVEGKNKA